MFDSLEKYLEVAVDHYDAHLDSVNCEAGIAGVKTTLRFHHLRFDANGQPKFGDLARCLAQHVVTFCLSAQQREPADRWDQRVKIANEAKRLFRADDRSGEAGELLLYFLLETVLGAPQIVAKMDLKMNAKAEVHGSDGIHVRWHREDGQLDLYFGESKLEQDVGSALTNAFASIERFHVNGMQEHEFGMVTRHYKWAESETKRSVLRYIDRGQPGGDCRINHACLIGYNWEEYAGLSGVALGRLEAEFKARYINDAERLRTMLARRFNDCTRRHLRFEMFFLPFRSVQEFRTAFVRELHPLTVPAHG